MRTLLITLSCVFAAITGTVYAGNAKSENDVKVSEVRKVDAFSSVQIASVGTIYFTQSDTYSFKIEGKEEYVKNTSSSVNKGRLVIGAKEKKSTNDRKGVTIYLSAPDLKKVEFSGVGAFYCKEPLKLNDVEFQVKGVSKLKVDNLTCRSLTVELKGVGNADVHVDCEKLSANMGGVGSVTLSGTAGRAEVSKSGIGSMNTRNLKIGK